MYRRWGYTYELTPEHLTPEQFNPLKQSYDVTGEQVLERLNQISPPARSKELPKKSVREFSEAVPPELHTESDQTQQAKVPQRDLYALLRLHAGSDPLLNRFWSDINTVPSWVNWDQIERGQDVFYRYGAANLTGLAFQSLLGGMGAARVVETLARTGGFTPSKARGRLFETTQHILQCTRSLESMKPGGEGFASTIRVRLLHAAVRQRILSLEATRPGYYDVEAWGIPINDLDSIATIATFSSTLIWLSLPRQGIFLRKREIADYVALWRYVAYVIGCPDIGFRTPDEARRLGEVLLYHEISPTPTGRVMANNIIEALANKPPAYLPADFLAATARWLNGSDLCDQLGIPRPGWYYWALMAGQCLFFGTLSYVYRLFPSQDRKKIAALKRIFYRIIVHSDFGLKGEETAFEFKYVPEYATITAVAEKSEQLRAMDGNRKMSDVERRNWHTFLVAASLVLLCTAFGIRALVRMLF